MNPLELRFSSLSPRLNPQPPPLAGVALYTAIVAFWALSLVAAFSLSGLAAWAVGVVYICLRHAAADVCRVPDARVVATGPRRRDFGRAAPERRRDRGGLQRGAACSRRPSGRCSGRATRPIGSGSPTTVRATTPRSRARALWLAAPPAARRRERAEPGRAGAALAAARPSRQGACAQCRAATRRHRRRGDGRRRHSARARRDRGDPQAPSRRTPTSWSAAACCRRAAAAGRRGARCRSSRPTNMSAISSVATPGRRLGEPVADIGRLRGVPARCGRRGRRLRSAMLGRGL